MGNIHETIIETVGLPATIATRRGFSGRRSLWAALAGQARAEAAGE